MLPTGELTDFLGVNIKIQAAVCDLLINFLKALCQRPHLSRIEFFGF